jgi:hypothetical protein
MSSSLNTLIGTFSSIDTSNNRIGINTIDPSYSIHIKKTSNTSNARDPIIDATNFLVTQGGFTNWKRYLVTSYTSPILYIDFQATII